MLLYYPDWSIACDCQIAKWISFKRIIDLPGFQFNNYRFNVLHIIFVTPQTCSQLKMSGDGTRSAQLNKKDAIVVLGHFGKILFSQIAFILIQL